MEKYGRKQSGAWLFVGFVAEVVRWTMLEWVTLPETWRLALAPLSKSLGFRSVGWHCLVVHRRTRFKPSWSKFYSSFTSVWMEARKQVEGSSLGYWDCWHFTWTIIFQCHWKYCPVEGSIVYHNVQTVSILCLQCLLSEANSTGLQEEIVWVGCDIYIEI